jgi:hypothetical protein
MSIFIRGVFAAAAMAIFGGAEAAELSPTDIVGEIYRLELGPKGDMSTKPLYSFTDPQIQRHMSRDFQKLVARMNADQSKTNEAILDWDPISDGNGAVPLGVKIEETASSAAKAKVVAKFHNAGGERKAVTYRFVRENGAWKIDDIVDKAEDIRNDILKGLASK